MAATEVDLSPILTSQESGYSLNILFCGVIVTVLAVLFCLWEEVVEEVVVVEYDNHACARRLVRRGRWSVAAIPLPGWDGCFMGAPREASLPCGSALIGKYTISG